MSLPPSSTSQDSSLPVNPTLAGARSTRSQHTLRHNPTESRRGLPPISTGNTTQTRPTSSSSSPSRIAFSPSSSNPNLAAVVAASRQATSRKSSTSSTNSLVSPPSTGHTAAALRSGSRSRAVTASGSPRLASSLVTLPTAGQGSTGGGSSRLARHSPSHSLSTTGSPNLPAGGAGGAAAGQLTSLVITQLNILLSTIKEDKDRAKWETQAEKIRKLLYENGMELFAQYFRRLVQSNVATLFPGTRALSGSDNAGSYQLLVEEMQKVAKDLQQADKIAQALDTSEGDLFRDFDLATFIDHFRLDPITKVSLASSCRLASKPDFRTKADAILTASFPSFLATVAGPQSAESEQDLTSLMLASITERLTQDPPRNWGDEHRENLFYALRRRYNRLNARLPPPIESAMFLAELLESQDSRLARLVQRTGSRGTSSKEACSEMLASVETRDISFSQIANALLFTAIAQNGDAFDPAVFVEGVREHRAGAKIDWTDVVQGFDQEHLRVTKKQFLALYHALLPLAHDYANFDIQSLWGGQWHFQETQLSFVVAFLSTVPSELDVTAIPDLRQAFKLTDFASASESVRTFAEQAIKHPLVSRDATEALFTMIFRSQETYNLAQMLGIPDTVINQNMTVFVCAASAVPKPWAPLQDQALKQLFYPFLLRQHDNYDFVMHALWEHDKSWIATRMVDFYQQDPMLLTLIYDHALEHNWLELLFTIQSNFALDLATYAHGLGHCNLEEWAQQHINGLGPPSFSRALADFIKVKMDDETQVQRDRAPPSTPPLAVKTLHTLLMLIVEAVPDDAIGPLYRQSLQLYPRLSNYGEDEERDAIIDSNGEHGNSLPESATKEMEERYKDMYGGNTNPENLVIELNRLKVSTDPAEQDLFAAMLFGLFEEYNCFGEYPNEALATTAVLFGGLVSYQVVSGISEQAAIFMILEAVSEYGPEDPMYRFGLQALLHLLGRLKEWPYLAERIMHMPSLRGTQAVVAAENALKELQQENIGLNGDGGHSVTNGAIDEEFAVDASPPVFASVQIDAPIREDFYEEPNEEISDKVTFVLNNVSKRNFEEKFKEIEGALDEKYHQWFAHYLVEELAKSQPNFQSLYLQILENFNQKLLWAEVLRETYISCQKMLNAQSTMDNQHERTVLKNLAGWLGSITLARNQPILHRNISFKDLLLEGYDTQRLIVAIPFTCKTLVQAAHSKVFKPPNPWIEELLGLLSELYHCMELKLNMKFEIEVLCREFNLDIKTIEPLAIIRGRPSLDASVLPQYVPDGAGPDAFGDMALMGLSKRGPNDRFSPDAVIRQIPDLSGLLHIPTAVGNVTQQQLREIFVNAAQQAIYEIIAPVVERSVTIASISTSELIQKDFITEADEVKMRNSAHTMVKSLSGSLALVTCKEPLRMSITNNIRLLARNLPEQLPEGQILMFVNDNIDTVCSLVEHAAEDHSLAEIDLQLQNAIDERRQHSEQRPNEPFLNTPITRWATLIPEPFRQDLNGLNRQQLALYEEFGRQARITPASHANNASQDSSRQLPDVLADGYLPSLATPAETPAMPRHTQQQRLLTQAQQNGYIDNPILGQRILEAMSQLQQASREAPEQHIGQIGESSLIRQIYEQLVMIIEQAQPRDTMALICGQQCLAVIYTDSQKALEVEVFVRLLVQLCRLSIPAGRHLTMQLASADDDRIFNSSATLALLHENLIDPQHIDNQVAKALRQRRTIGLTFLNEILDDLLLGDAPVALRADFVYTYEALSQWLSEEPDRALARNIMNMLQTPATQRNGVSSPESDNKVDQLEYIFEEWIRLQRNDTSERSYLAFLNQLHEQQVISDPHDALAFFRAALEMSCAAFDRIHNVPYGTTDQAYIAVDALAKLIAFMVLFQSPAETEQEVTKAKSLDAIVRLVVLVINEHHNKNRESWNGRLYFRLFSTLLCELHSNRERLTQEQEQEVYGVFASALKVLQPRYFAGFTFPWLALLSHRLLVPAFLTGSARTNGGWDTFTKLLQILFANLEQLLAIADSPPVVQEFYRGVLRFFTMLHHDFPEYLTENHMHLNSAIPMQCVQLQNIVNSAVTRAIFNEQPDPFTPGMKINRLEQVRSAPPLHDDVEPLLERANLLPILKRACAPSSDGPSDADFTSLRTILDPDEPTPLPILLINASILYIGSQATTASSVFSSASAPARLLDRLLRDSRPRARAALTAAMTNQVRYVNAHTHYFSTALQHFFSVAPRPLQELILRVLCERLMVPRPHPWGLIVLMLELLRNQSTDLFSLPCIQDAPQVESTLRTLAQNHDHLRAAAAAAAAGGAVPPPSGPAARNAALSPRPRPA